MKIGDLVNGRCGVGVLLERQGNLVTRWRVCWFDGVDDWSWEFEEDLEQV